MIYNSLLTIVKVLLLFASFVGLCAGLRVRFKINRFIAPFIAVCCIIVILMFSGMLDVLKIGYWALIALGYWGLVWTYGIKKIRPEYGLIGTALLLAAIFTWRFYPTIVHSSDDVAHWALAVRHMLLFDAFPTSEAKYILYQSYPLGAASFIYYVERFVSGGERVYFIAHNFLLAVLFLPMFSLAKPEIEKKFRPFLILLFLVLFHYNNTPAILWVDLHLGFFGIGTAAAILHYRSNLKKALFSALPAMAAVIFFKSSGIFFAALTAVGLIFAAVHRENTPPEKFSPLCACMHCGPCRCIPALVPVY